MADNKNDMWEEFPTLLDAAKEVNTEIITTRALGNDYQPASFLDLLEIEQLLKDTGVPDAYLVEEYLSYLSGEVKIG